MSPALVSSSPSLSGGLLAGSEPTKDILMSDSKTQGLAKQLLHELGRPNVKLPKVLSKLEHLGQQKQPPAWLEREATILWLCLSRSPGLASKRIPILRGTNFKVGCKEAWDCDSFDVEDAWYELRACLRLYLEAQTEARGVAGPMPISEQGKIFVKGCTIGKELPGLQENSTRLRFLERNKIETKGGGRGNPVWIDYEGLRNACADHDLPIEPPATMTWQLIKNCKN